MSFNTYFITSPANVLDCSRGALSSILRIKGSEEISRLFEYEIDLILYQKSQIEIKKILGESLTITLENSESETPRYYHGVVAQFKHLGLEGSHDNRDGFSYRVVLRPWLWFLTRRSNCRIFQNQSVPEIIQKVFEDLGFSDFKFSLTQTYPKRDYCVQYRETDFDFVSRLLECEGIFYFFTHEQAKHTLVIADSVNAYQEVANHAEIPYYGSGISNINPNQQHCIFEWHNHHEVQSGTYVLNDFDFENPSASLLTKFIDKKTYSHAEGEHYDYPGNYLETKLGESYATTRLNELQTHHAMIHGKSMGTFNMASGMIFTLKNHYIAQENAKHVVIAIEFLITAESQDTYSFKAIPAEQLFKPRRITPVPFVQGPQTAIVVGKSGEEIWTDKYGRVKVQFHWDRDGTDDENSSCWVRVSHPTAGKNWGWVSLPRIGQEVIVSFLEGNPDRPIITGRVYNSDQMPPYTLPANQTQSGIKTRSSKEGTGENFNEIRFEDKKGSEELCVHAEKDFNCVIENNETRKIGLDKKDAGNQTLEIHNDRTVTLNEGNDTLTVKKGNRVTSVDTGDNTLTVKTGNRVTNVDTGDNTLTVKTGNRITNIDTGNDTKTVKIGDYTVKVNAGKATIEAMESIELKVGGNSIKINQQGITVKGIAVTVQADSTLDAKSSLTTVSADAVLTLKGSMTKIN